MQDILFELPSYCDDCETWHKEFIWAHEDGSYSSCDECGDHEPLEADELPSDEEYARLWREYREWVLDRGEDPLGEFNVRHSIKVNERWEFKLFKSLTGPRLSAARHAKRIYQPQELPEHVRSFLNLSPDNKLGDFANWQELIDVLPDVRPYQWFAAHLEEDHSRKPETIARELRQAARKSLTKSTT
jgi:hypothetical protein